MSYLKAVKLSPIAFASVRVENAADDGAKIFGRVFTDNGESHFFDGHVPSYMVDHISLANSIRALVPKTLTL